MNAQDEKEATPKGPCQIYLPSGTVTLDGREYRFRGATIRISQQAFATCEGEPRMAGLIDCSIEFKSWVLSFDSDYYRNLPCLKEHTHSTK